MGEGGKSLLDDALWYLAKQDRPLYYKGLRRHVMANLAVESISPINQRQGLSGLEHALPHHTLEGDLDWVAQEKEGITTSSSFEAGLRALILLNVMDAFFTLQWIDKGKATEANPIMAFALDHGPGFFILSKVALVLLAGGLLWRHRERFTARLALVPVAILYAYVAGGHLGFALSLALDGHAPAG